MNVVPGLTPEAQRIVERWNPAGIDRWRESGGGARTVHVTTVPGLDATGVRDGLAAHVPVTDRPGDAAAVVFVLDALSVLGRDELSALDVVGAHVERVLFTTPTDAPWALRERDEALLRAHSPRYADARILNGAELHGAVRAALDAPPGVIVERNRRRAALSLVEETCRMITTTAESVRADDIAPLRQRRTRLTSNRGGDRAELSALVRSDVQRARIELVHTVGVRIRELSTLVRSEIDRAGRRELATYPDRFAQLADALTAEVDTVVGHRLDDLVVRAGLTHPPVRPPEPTEVSVSAPEPRHRGVEDRMMVIVGASAGVGLGRLAVAPLSMVPALDIATIPVTLTLGGAAAWWLARSRRHLADRAHLRQWAADATTGLRAQLEQRVLARLLETEAAVGQRVLADGRAATAAVDAEIAAVDAEIRRVAAQRSGRLASCERDHGALVEALAALEGRVLEGRVAVGTTREPNGPVPRPTP
ncbi:hypothetical protein GS463_03730 [Rhodococcus hoagii]|uniref:Uncharacterized protein n=1 Tax=Rhodococcus hoagii TaxID=43767 RepID=A0AAE3BB92_RHOHA|nr:hypothetical protein [Prescottella equi]MBM4538305.1 hypothetical protein [Prescottella equi]MBM4715139.1 hypothetical protein [Prescottella equi]NKS10512.1 hypothetical protein [Prescottella equi]